MTDTDRFRLLGTYTTLVVPLGTILTCEYRDRDVIVDGYTAGPIPWPIGRVPRTSHRSPVVCGELVAAVRLESNLAVAHWFGVRSQLVTAWRKALGVPTATPGTVQLVDAAMGDDERNEGIAAARRGKARLRGVMDAAHEANRGRKQPVAERRRRSVARAGRGRADLRPWAPAEDELVRTLAPKEVVAKTGRTLGAVYSRRWVLRQFHLR